METRPKNASQHPGNVEKKRHRRTKAEMAVFRAEEAALKAAAAEQHQANIQKVADLEKSVAEATDDTPRARPRPQPRAVRRTETYVESRDEGSEVDRYDHTSDLDFKELTEGETDAEEENRVKKKLKEEAQPKVKDPKPKLRDAVDNARKAKEGDERSEKGGDGRGMKLADGGVSRLADGGDKAGDGGDKAGERKSSTHVQPHDDGKMDKSGKAKSKSDMSRPGAGLAYTVKNWADNIPKGSKPGSKASKATVSSRLPSLTQGTSRSTVSSLSDQVLITDNNACIDLSDDEERFGPEREHAIKSPPKGRRRLSSSGMVKVEDTAQEIPKQAFTAKDRAGNDHLPAGAHDGGRFRKKYIPTVIAYISPLLDAFKFSDKELLNIYQASWNTVYGSVVPYKIEVRDAVFNITSQRISDAWRSVIGSSALSVLNSFFDSDEAYSTNEARQAFAKEALEGLAFLYGNTTSKKFKDLFRGPFVLKTFGAHFTATAGSQKVRALGSLDAAENYPFGGLGLSAAAFERALTLYKNGDITIEAVETSRVTSKAIVFKPSLNKETGKISTSSTAFNERNWGSKVRGYTKAAKNLRPERMLEIMQLGLGNSKAIARLEDSDFETDIHRSQLVDISDNDDEPLETDPAA